MKSDVKSVIMEEMYERTDSEKKTIREIKEIMSSKEKFLNSVDSVVFVFRKIVGDSGNVNYLNFGNFEAENDFELRYFYDEYKTRGYDNFEIYSADSYVRSCRYRVEMYKKYDGYTLYAVMILYVKGVEE